MGMIKKRNRLINRNYSVCADRAAGHTYRQIAENNNISITRVRQIISRWMAEYINQYKPLYLCNPELNKKCKKTSCQTDCFHTTNPEYSLDGKKYNIDLKTCEIREIPKGNE